MPWTRDIDGNLRKTEAMSDLEIYSEACRCVNTIYDISDIAPHHREGWQQRELDRAKRYLQDLENTE